MAGSIDHADPFQCSTNSVDSLPPVAVVVYPTAQQSDVVTHVTPWSRAPDAPGGFGVETIDQAVPFQCAANVPVGWPPWPASMVPTAQQSAMLTHVTPKNPPWTAGFAGTADSDHVAPFHCSINGVNCASGFVPSPVTVVPTVQHSTAFAHVLPRTMSSGSPLLGLVTMFQPDGPGTVAAVAASEGATNAVSGTRTALAARASRRQPLRRAITMRPRRGSLRSSARTDARARRPQSGVENGVFQSRPAMGNRVATTRKPDSALSTRTGRRNASRSSPATRGNGADLADRRPYPGPMYRCGECEFAYDLDRYGSSGEAISGGADEIARTPRWS